MMCRLRALNLYVFELEQWIKPAEPRMTLKYLNLTTTTTTGMDRITGINYRNGLLSVVLDTSNVFHMHRLAHGGYRK